jgi:hypothetical protein
MMTTARTSPARWPASWPAIDNTGENNCRLAADGAGYDPADAGLHTEEYGRTRVPSGVTYKDHMSPGLPDFFNNSTVAVFLFTRVIAGVAHRTSGAGLLTSRSLPKVLFAVFLCASPADASVL